MAVNIRQISSLILQASAARACLGPKSTLIAKAVHRIIQTIGRKCCRAVAYHEKRIFTFNTQFHQVLEVRMVFAQNPLVQEFSPWNTR